MARALRTTSVKPAGRLALPVTRIGQLVLSHQARTQTVFAARQVGKSTLGQGRILLGTRRPNAHGHLGWLAPVYKQVKQPYRNLRRVYEEAGLLSRAVDSDLTLELRTGWRVDFRSLDDPHNIRGETYDGYVVDEMQRVPDRTYYEAVWPTIASTGGWALNLGTPCGKQGWGYRLYVQGQGGDPDEKSFKFTCYDSDTIAPEEIERARRTMSKRAFRQEFLAEFLDGVGAVFEDVRQRRAVPVPGEPVGVGADWAKKEDYTWFVAVGAKSGAILEVQRLPHLVPYDKQVGACARFCARFQGRGFYLCHDQTGVGEAVNDIIMAARTPEGGRLFRENQVEGFKFSNASKQELVEETVVDFEGNQLGWVDGVDDPDYERAIMEHEYYTLTVNDRGKIVYGAPEGLHDDAVDAEMLANRARRKLSQKARQFEPRITIL